MKTAGTEDLKDAAPLPMHPASSKVSHLACIGQILRGSNKNM